MEKISSTDYCRQFVRDCDYNLYLLHFFVPRHKRNDILSVMALHNELRDIPKKVQDPMLRLIRLQWWRDEVEKLNSDLKKANSPILESLQHLPSSLSFNNYFDRFDKSFRGEDSDVEEALYEIFGTIINDPKQNNRFSKRLCLHDQWDKPIKWRAFRLWLGY